MRVWVAVILACFWCGMLFAQEDVPKSPLEVVVPARVELGRMAVIEIKSAVGLDTVKLRIRQNVPGEDMDVEPSSVLPLKEEGKYVFSSPTPGTYTVHVSVFDTAAKQILDAYSRVEIAGPGPGPNPTPPPPVPVVGTRLAVILLETAADNPALSSMLVSLRRRGSTAAEYLEAKGHQLLVLDKDSQMAKSYLDLLRARGVPLPALIVLDSRKGVPDGVYSVDRLPQSAEAVIEALKKTGG